MYYGEEIGMQNNDPKSKEEVRDPQGRIGWPLEKGRDGELPCNPGGAQYVGERAENQRESCQPGIGGQEANKTADSRSFLSDRLGTVARAFRCVYCQARRLIAARNEEG
jgi:hypothetical protein